jgi:hypothetical protein
VGLHKTLTTEAHDVQHQNNFNVKEKTMAESKHPYLIVALPLIATAQLTPEDIAAAEAYVQKYGYYAFAPANVATIPQTTKLCTFLYAVLKLLLLNEHEAAYELEGKQVESPFVPTGQGSRAGSNSKLAQQIVSQARGCDPTGQRINKSLPTLISDLYRGRDMDFVFGGPIRMGPQVPWKFYHSDFELAEREATPFTPLTDAEMTTLQKMEANYAGTRRRNVAPELPFIRPRFKTASALLLLSPEDGSYLGHIYVWPSEYAETVDVIGIRASLLQLECRLVATSIAEKLIIATLLWAEQYGFHFVNVEQPLQIMQDKLLGLGFKPVRERGLGSRFWFMLDRKLIETHVQDFFGPQGYALLDYGCRFPWNSPVLQQPLQLQNGTTETEVEQSLAAQYYGNTEAASLASVGTFISAKKQQWPYYWRGQDQEEHRQEAFREVQQAWPH